MTALDGAQRAVTVDTTTTLNLLAHHQKRLDASAISREVAAARQYVSITERRQLLDLGFSRAQARVPGLLIPRWRMDGEQDGYQYRPDSPRTNPKGDAIKYESPPKQRNVLDVSPVLRAELRKPQQPIFITEGARKVDALASVGIPGISLAGVYGWRGRNEVDGTTRLPDWEEVNIKGNGFILAFDNDILTKKPVHDALSRLMRWLEWRGAAYVNVLELPNDGEKVGVDDYIASLRKVAA